MSTGVSMETTPVQWQMDSCPLLSLVRIAIGQPEIATRTTFTTKKKTTGILTKTS